MKNYDLIRGQIIIFLMLGSFLSAQSPVDDGIVIASEDYDAATMPPAPNGSVIFNATVQLSSDADPDGAPGQGVEFIYDANLFEDEEITLHTFSNVPPGDYIIQYDINAENAGFTYDAVISDGTSSRTQTVGIQTNQGAFNKRFTSQFTTTSMGNLSFTMQMSPFVSAFTNSRVYIDNVQLIRMNAPVPPVVAACSSVEQTENYDVATTPPPSMGPTSFTDNVELTADADVNGTGQGVEFDYTGVYAEMPVSIDLVTFSSVPAGTYLIRYQYDDGNTNSNLDFSYYNRISDGTNTVLNYVNAPSTTGFVTHRTYTITTSATTDISLQFMAGERSNNVAFGTPMYIDNVELVAVTLDDASFMYAAASYDTSDPDPTPTVSGVAGGTFSSMPAGLNVDPTTGEIDLASSTVGTYTVTYTTIGPCPASSEQMVTITDGSNTGADCSCNEYIYLNEVSNQGKVHKYEVAPDGSLTEVLVDVGGGNFNAWYPGTANSELPSPHGLGVDLNGFLYIGSSFSNDNASIRQLTCDGTITPEADFDIDIPRGALNVLTIDNTIYANIFTRPADGSVNDDRVISAFDACSGDLVATACLDGSTGGFLDWGFYYDERTGFFYSTEENGPSPLWRYTVDDFSPVGTPPTCVAPFLEAGPDNEPSVGERELPRSGLFGITTDEDGNIYLVNGFNNQRSRIIKYDASGAFIAATPYDDMEDGSGYFSSRGIVYSETSQQLYVSTTSAVDDCVYRFGRDLTDLGFAVPPNGDLTQGNPAFGQAKGIAISTECCPTRDQSFSEVVCYSGNDVNYFLNEIFSCGDGVVCEGQWSEVADANDVFSFNDCDLSITVTGEGCATYRLEKTTDATGTQRCGMFRVDVEICTGNPAATALTTEGTCTGDVPNNDAQINLVGIIGDVVGISSPDAVMYDGSSYDAAAVATDLQQVPATGSVDFTGLMPGTTYFIRVFGNGAACFVDYIVSTAETSCTEACPCPTTPFSLCWDDMTFVEPDGDPYPYTYTTPDIDGSGVSLTTTVFQPIRGEEDSYVTPGARCGCTFNDELEPYISCGDVFRNWKRGNLIPDTIIFSFSEAVRLPNYGFGGFRRNGNTRAIAELTFFDGPDGTGNKVVSTLPNPGGMVNINEGDALDAANAINMLLIGNRTDNVGVQETELFNDSYYFQGLSGNVRGWTILNLGEAEIRSIRLVQYSTSATEPQDFDDNIVDPGNNNSGYVSSLDFEVCDCTASVSLGDTTFFDLNENGLQDSGESGVAGVTVTVFNADGSPVTLDASGGAYNNVTTTDMDGFYEFTNLPPGDYYVVFDVSTAPGGEFFTFTTNMGGDEANDSDADPATGQSDNTGFIPGGENFPDLDAGVICNISAEAGDPQTICGTRNVDLNTLGATFTPMGVLAMDGTPFQATWTSSGTGTFDDGNNGIFGMATTYTPSEADITAGEVTLTLTTDNPSMAPFVAAACGPVMDQVTITILKVDCGTYPWSGNR